MNEPITDTGSIRSPVGVVGFVLRFVQKWALRYMLGKGVMIALIGFSWIIQPSPGREAGIAWIDAVQPWMIGVVWMVAGTWAAIASRLHRPLAHRLGWFGLIAAPAITALYFTVAWIIALLPVPEGGSARGWITAVSYGAFAMAYCVSRIQTEVAEISRAWEDE